MNKSIATISLGLLMSGLGCGVTEQGTPEPAPPIAQVVPHELEKHGHVRQGEYYWLNQREDPEVVDYPNPESGT